MAAKKPKAPKKFKQARKAAVADAKGAFTSGKTKAVRRDPMAKVSAEDKAVLSEIKKEAKGNYITDDKGNKVFQKPTETAQERIARDRREAKAAVDRMYEKEDAKAKKPSRSIGGTAGTVAKPKPGLSEQLKKDIAKVNDRRTPAEKKASLKAASKEVKKNTKKFVQKGSSKVMDTPVGTNKPSAAKSMTRAEKSAANKAAWAKMTPAERKNWSASKPGSALPKMSMAEMKAQNKKALDGLKKDIEATKKSTTKPKIKTGVAAKGELSTSKEVDAYKKAVASGKSKGEAVRIAKGGASNLPAVVAKKGAGTVAKKGLLRTAAGLAGKAVTGRVGLALTAGSLLAGPLLDQMNKGSKSGKASGSTTTGRGGGATGFVTDKPKAKKVLPSSHILKKKSYVETTASGKRYLSSAHMSSAGSKNKTIVGAGGSTYTVKKGDTLSGIAKNSGVKLSEILAANPTIADKKSKYKGGSMIWSGTKVKLPTKK
jgi:LysM repeat protein